MEGLALISSLACSIPASMGETGARCLAPPREAGRVSAGEASVPPQRTRVQRAYSLPSFYSCRRCATSLCCCVVVLLRRCAEGEASCERTKNASGK